MYNPLIGAGAEPQAALWARANAANAQPAQADSGAYPRAKIKFEREKLEREIAERAAERMSGKEAIMFEYAQREKLANADRDAKAQQYDKQLGFDREALAQKGSQFGEELGIKKQGLDQSGQQYYAGLKQSDKQFNARNALDQERLGFEREDRNSDPKRMFSKLLFGDLSGSAAPANDPAGATGSGRLLPVPDANPDAQPAPRGGPMQAGYATEPPPAEPTANGTFSQSLGLNAPPSGQPRGKMTQELMDAMRVMYGRPSSAAEQADLDLKRAQTDSFKTAAQLNTRQATREQDMAEGILPPAIAAQHRAAIRAKQDEAAQAEYTRSRTADPFGDRQKAYERASQTGGRVGAGQADYTPFTGFQATEPEANNNPLFALRQKISQIAGGKSPEDFINEKAIEYESQRSPWYASPKLTSMIPLYGRTVAPSVFKSEQREPFKQYMRKFGLTPEETEAAIGMVSPDS